MNRRDELREIAGFLQHVLQRPFCDAYDEQVHDAAWRLEAMLPGEAVEHVADQEIDSRTATGSMGVDPLIEGRTPRRDGGCGAFGDGKKRTTIGLGPSGSAASSSSARDRVIGAAANAANELRLEQCTRLWRGGDDFAPERRPMHRRASLVEYIAANRGPTIGDMRISVDEVGLASWRMDEAVVLIRVFHMVLKPFAMERCG